MTPKHLLGLAALARLSASETALALIADDLNARARADENDAEALLDFSTVMEIKHRPDLAAALQREALKVRRDYVIEREGPAGLRVLALMAPGDIATNAPLDFLLEGSDVELRYHYLDGSPIDPRTLPEHDLLFVAVCAAEGTEALLRALITPLAAWPRPVLNRPERILETSRENTFRLLDSAQGVAIPPSARLTRERVAAIARGGALPFEGAGFPLIIRPLDSHAGRGLARIESPDALSAYLAERPESDFYTSPFIDYRSADGLFRKYRVVFMQGKPYAVHMAISSDWMIHYINAGMTDSPEKREEEAAFMARFDADFARRHRDALAAIAARFALDYLVMDCGEAPDGRLLGFEVDIGAVIHDLDPADRFPYKKPQMSRVFTAFRAMAHTAARPARASS